MSWAAPDAHAGGSTALLAPDPATTVSSDGDMVAPDARQPRTARELRSLVPLRPMTTTDVIDGGIAVIKAAPAQVLTIAALTVVPVELASAWIHRDSLADRGIAGAFRVASSGGSTNSDFSGSSIVLLAVSGLLLAVVTGAIATLIAGWHADRVPTTGEALGASFRRFPALAVAWFVVHLIEVGALVAFVVPLLFVLPLVAVVTPVVVIERAGPFRAIRRSGSLARRRYGAMLGAVLLIAVSDIVLTIAISGISLLFSSFSFGWIVDAIALAGSALITTPFVAGAVTLLYFDLRVRSEGLDLELAIAEHFDVRPPVRTAS
jgi:hypothetical protein